MTITEVVSNIESGKYRPGIAYPKEKLYPSEHIFDEKASVLWNRQRVKEENARIQALRQSYHDMENKGYTMFREDLSAALQNDYGLLPQHADIVVEKAESDGHSGGFHEVVSCALDLADFVIRITESSSKS